MPAEVREGLDKVGGLRALDRRIPDPSRIAALARHYKVLSDKIRLKLLYALSLTDMCPCVLKVTSGTSDSKLSYHLRLLEAEGLITSKRVKYWRIYSITADGLRALRSWKC
ncbi:MAG: metalloregulator ArsR/SmtB family transcription factor [Thermoplasmata archaeon]